MDQFSQLWEKDNAVKRFMRSEQKIQISKLFLRTQELPARPGSWFPRSLHPQCACVRGKVAMHARWGERGVRVLPEDAVAPRSPCPRSPRACPAVQTKFLSYKTVRFSRVNNWRLGLAHRVLQLAIFIYIVVIEVPHPLTAGTRASRGRPPPPLAPTGFPPPSHPACCR